MNLKPFGLIGLNRAKVTPRGKQRQAKMRRSDGSIAYSSTVQFWFSIDHPDHMHVMPKTMYLIRHYND